MLTLVEEGSQERYQGVIFRRVIGKKQGVARKRAEQEESRRLKSIKVVCLFVLVYLLGKVPGKTPQT